MRSLIQCLATPSRPSAPGLKNDIYTSEEFEWRSGRVGIILKLSSLKIELKIILLTERDGDVRVSRFRGMRYGRL